MELELQSFRIEAGGSSAVHLRFNMKKMNVPVSSYFLAPVEQFQCMKV